MTIPSTRTQVGCECADIEPMLKFLLQIGVDIHRIEMHRCDAYLMGTSTQSIESPHWESLEVYLTEHELLLLQTAEPCDYWCAEPNEYELLEQAVLEVEWREANPRSKGATVLDKLQRDYTSKQLSDFLNELDRNNNTLELATL